MSHFQHFKTDISGIQTPEKFTFPFYYEPHQLAEIAVSELQEYLENQTDFKHNFGLEENQNSLPIGKMFGVLVVKNQQNEIGYLAAFSGKLADESFPLKFVPPIFNMNTDGGFYKKVEAELNTINATISELENDSDFIKLQTLFLAKKSKIDNELLQLKQQLKANKKDRKKRLKTADDNFNIDEVETLRNQLKQESFNDQFLLKELTEYRESQISKIKNEVDFYTSKIEVLKATRKQKSNKLQEDLFNKYQFLNLEKETKGIIDIFPDFKEQKPPAGTGDCSAPKLFQYAFLHNLRPIALAEFWWGKSPNSEIRKHKNFYPACQGRCKPILSHMLDGIEMDENPLLQNVSVNKKIEIVFEDDFLAVINKPEELLSVPGKEISDSVFTRVEKLFPEATGPLIIHRLDMATSGILLIAKTKKAHKKLQSQFINRTVKKRYVALLDGNINKNEGEINLPLRLDIDDRPRQLVCFEHGKKAVTKWKVVERFDNKTRIQLYPITGRTHQLRVHCSHPLGLNTPIIGDDLYGEKANRLHLHAEFIEFEHPSTKKQISFTVPPNF